MTTLPLKPEPAELVEAKKLVKEAQDNLDKARQKYRDLWLAARVHRLRHEAALRQWVRTPDPDIRKTL